MPSFEPPERQRLFGLSLEPADASMDSRLALASRVPNQKRFGALAVLTCLAAWVGCGGASSYRLDHGIDRKALSAAQLAEHKRYVEQGDTWWKRRADLRAVEQALANWQQAIAIKDDDWATYARLARGYFFQADAHVGLAAMGGDYPFDADDAVDKAAAERYKRLLRRGYRTALRGMAARSREFEQRLEGGIDLEEAIRVMRKDAAPLVYWYVANLASFARADGYATLFSMRTRILGCIEHLHHIDADYFYRGADRLLGIYYAAAPAMVGGSLDRSRAHFETAVRAAPHFLTTQLFTAEFLDRRAKDRRAFETHLKAVLEAPAPAAGAPSEDVGPENEVARQKARRLLGRIDRYFGHTR